MHPLERVRKSEQSDSISSQGVLNSLSTGGRGEVDSLRSDEKEDIECF